MLMSELAHMRKLYNDIIYFVQNHVQPVAPSSAASPFLLKPHGFNYSQRGMAAGLNNSGSTTSSSSLTIVEEPSAQIIEHNNNNNSNSSNNKAESSSGQPRLFGVALTSAGGGSNKRGVMHLDDPSSSTSTKPRLVLNREDLGFNTIPSSPSS